MEEYIHYVFYAHALAFHFSHSTFVLCGWEETDIGKLTHTHPYLFHCFIWVILNVYVHGYLFSMIVELKWQDKLYAWVCRYGAVKKYSKTARQWEWAPPIQSFLQQHSDFPYLVTVNLFPKVPTKLKQKMLINYSLTEKCEIVNMGLTPHHTHFLSRVFVVQKDVLANSQLTISHPPVNLIW